MTAPAKQSMTESTTLEEAFDHIAAEPKVWVRVAAVRGENGAWKERLLELTSGTSPTSWEQHWEQPTWEYPSALFVATIESGAVIAEWLRSGTITLADQRHIAIPSLIQNSRPAWRHRQSYEAAPYETLSWPVSEASFSQNDSSPTEPQGHLVSDGRAPSFVNFYTAAASFFWFDRRPSGGAVNQGIGYRHQDTTARINRVRISDDGIDVEVEGDGLKDLTIELAGEAPGETRYLRREWEKTALVSFQLLDGLPPGAWVLLRRGSQWIDRRFLSGQWTSTTDHGVEYLVDPLTRLEAFLANREGPQVEFKRQINDPNKAKTMKTVCAFANESGGSVLFGIDDENDHELIGIEPQRIDRMKDQLTQIVDSWVEPTPTIAFTTLPIEDTDKVVLEMEVLPGLGLYGCGRPGETKVAYVRRQAITVKARTSEIEAIVRSRPLMSSPSLPWAL